MDLGYPMDRPYRPIPPDLAAPAQRITSFLGSGGGAIVVVGPARAGKRALLDGLLAGMPGRITRIENRTGLPLALDGVLKQMGKVAESEGDERGLFFRTLAEQAYDDYSAVIAVEDAHTLTSLALTALARVPGLGGPDLPGMVLLLSGEAGLLEKLEGPGLEGLRNARRTLTITLPQPVVPAGGLAAPAAGSPSGSARAETPAAARPASAETVGWARGNLGLRGVVIAVLAGAFAAAGGLTWSLVPHRRPLPAMEEVSATHALSAPVAEPALPSPPEPMAVPPAAPAPIATAAMSAAPVPAAPVPTAPPETPLRPADALPTETATRPDATAAAPAPASPSPTVAATNPEEALRREFDAFLNRAGRDTAKLTPVARESLFREYQQWRVREAGRAP